MSAISNCKICKQNLESSVLLVCCQENVCWKCLKTMSRTDVENETKIYNCTLCQQVNQHVNNCSRNELLDAYIQDHDQNASQKVVVCNRCEKSLVLYDTVRCAECNVSDLCSNCYEEIHDKGRYKLHKPIRTNGSVLANCGTADTKKASVCLVHGQNVTDICMRDLSCLCKQCIAEHKKVCKYPLLVQLSEAHCELTTLVMQNFEKLLHKKTLWEKEQLMAKEYKTKVTSNFSSLVDDAKKSFANLKELLDLKEHELCSQLEHTKIRLLQQSESREHAVSTFLKRIEDLTPIVNFASVVSSPVLASGFQFLMQRIEKISLEAPNIDFHTISHFPVAFKLQNLEEVLQNLDKLTIQEFGAEKSLNTKRKDASSTKANHGHVTPTRKQQHHHTSSNVPKLFEEHPKPKEMQLVSPLVFKTGTQSRNSISATLNTECSSSSSRNPGTPRQLGSIKELDNALGFTAARNPLQEVQPNASHKDKSPISKKTNKELSFLNLGATTNVNERLQGRKDFSPSVSSRKNDISLTPGGRSKQHITPNKISHLKNDRIDRPSSISDFQLNNMDISHLNSINKHPLTQRVFIKHSATSNSIMVAWSHSSQQSDIYYKLEFGIGARINGEEQFREAYRGSSNSHIINDLRSKTTYRVRVCAIQQKKKESSSPNKKDKVGEWSETLAVPTLGPQGFDEELLGSHAKIVSKGSENVIQFDRTGVVCASNGYTFGKIFWEIRTHLQSAHSCADDSMSLLKVGLTNKLGKHLTVCGTSINYGLNQTSIVVKLALDMDSRVLNISIPSQGISESFSSLPEGAVYPAVQNKTSKNGSSSLRVKVLFDQPSSD